MAPSPSTKPANYPLVAYNYRVVIDGLTMRFAKVEGLVWERTTVTYRDGLSFLGGEDIGTYRVDSYSTLSLHQGVVASDTKLHDWLQAGDARLLQLHLCRADGKPVISWQASRAIPVKLSGVSLDANANEVIMETLELRAAGWSINHPI